jgi:ribosomal protein S18 acetylase RimI-like enzyme
MLRMVRKVRARNRIMLIRQARIEDAAGIAKVHVDTWRTTYPGIVPQDYLDNLSYETHTQRWITWLSNPKTYAYVAEDEPGQIVGFVSGGPLHDDDPQYAAELYSIYILKGHQGQGIGRSLTCAMVERLLQERMSSMLLWTLPAGPASRFYETLGGKQVKTIKATLGGATVDEVAYGWSDIRTLLKE